MDIGSFGTFNIFSLEEIKEKIAELRRRLKSHESVAWAFVEALVGKIESITNEIKNGWGQAVIDSEQMSLDISKLKQDIAEIKKEAEADGGKGKVSDETAKKFAEDFKQYKTDLNKFKKDFEVMPGKKIPDGVEDLLDNLDTLVDQIGGTDVSGKKIDDIIAEAEKTGKWDGLADALKTLATPPKNSSNDDEETAPIDNWVDGDDTGRGLSWLDTDANHFKTAGERNLNKNESVLTNINNVAMNGVKNLNDLFAALVRGQVAS